MEEKFKKIFDLASKRDEFRIYEGDDLSMGSVPPYGISSGLPELDLYLGRKGGLPAAKIIEYWGPTASGKTTAALHAAAEWQKKGGLVIFIDAEQGLSPERFRNIGGKPENVVVHNTLTIEEIFDVLLMYTGEVDVETRKKSQIGLLEDFDVPVLFIVDSVTSVSVLADMKNKMADEIRVGQEARQIKRGLRRINPVLSSLKCKPSIIFITHAVAKIGGGFGKKSDSGGGSGIKFYSSVRVQFTAIQQTRDPKTKERTGMRTAVEVCKLKGGHLEYDKFNLDLTNEMGFDHFESMKGAMLATNFAKRPTTQSIMFLPSTKLEVQIKSTEFREYVEANGGYDEVYGNWKRWCIRNGYMSLWGGTDS